MAKQSPRYVLLYFVTLLSTQLMLQQIITVNNVLQPDIQTYPATELFTGLNQRQYMNSYSISAHNDNSHVISLSLHHHAETESPVPMPNVFDHIIITSPTVYLLHTQIIDLPIIASTHTATDYTSVVPTGADFDFLCMYSCLYMFSLFQFIGDLTCAQAGTCTLSPNYLAHWSLSIQVRRQQKLALSSTILNFDSNSSSHLILLLLLSGQIETNPGPTEYNCGVCANEVGNNDHAITCDNCQFWCHIQCVGLSENHYNDLLNLSSFSWICYQCGCPNFDSSIFGSGSYELSNPFSSLNDSLNDSIIENPVDGHPKTSTPTNQGTEHQFRKFSSPKNRQNKVKCMLINCNGLKGQGKQAAFRASIEHHNPDIIMGCESNISPDIATYSIFPENYTIHRNDRLARRRCIPCHQRKSDIC